MIDVIHTCDLCGKTAKSVPSFSTGRITLPAGWCGREKGQEYKDYYGESRIGSEFCSQAHRHSYQEAEQVASAAVKVKAMAMARKMFAKELRKLCLVAHSAVEALGNVVKDEK